MKLNPNLFIVGFQKCGSSSLFQLLSQFDDISVCNPKETFALTDSSFPLHNADRNVFEPKFEWGGYYDNKKVKYFLEASVCNFYQETALNYISTLSEKKVIFIIRNPIDRFVSTFDYFGKRIKNCGPIPDLNKYFEVVKYRNEQIEVEGAKYALKHGNYSYYINQWKDRIGTENIKVIGLKPLIKQPKTTINSICDFLELPHPESIQILHENKTKNIKNRRLNYFVTKFLSGSGLGHTSLGKLYQKLNSTSEKPKLNKELETKLSKIYNKEFKLYKDYF